MKLIYKNTLVKIKKSLGRYISLFVIVMVGVGVFSGLKASAPDILTGVDQYYKEHHLMDFKIVSSLGLTDEDVGALKKLKNVETVVPSYSLDVLDQGQTTRVHAIEESINTVKLIDGRMPETDMECLADGNKYKVGDKIKITSDVSDKLKNTEFTVVGTVKSPLYMAHDYGNTTVGDGTLSSFIYVNKNNFIMEAYTEIYIASNTQDAKAYSNEYEEFVSPIKEEIVEIKPERESARYQEIYSKASNEINDNEAKLKNEKEKNEKKLTDAKIQLDENSFTLKNAKEELAKNEADLQKNIETKNADFQTGRNKIANGWNEINAALKSNGMEKEELGAKINELDTTIQTMKAQMNQLPADSPEYAQFSATISQYSASYEGLLKLKTSIDALTAQEEQLNKGIKTFNTEIAKAKNEIEKGKNKIAENEKKLDDGYKEYNENLAKFNSEMDDANTKIEDARKDISEVKKAKWYVYDRDAVIGYDELKFGTDAIDSVAAVFPLFFIIIVILMTSNTMARMIVEERSELGTLTSLGYKDSRIIFTYLLYVLSATVLGTITGFYIGSSVIPHIIYAAFNQFILPPLVIQYDMLSLLLISAVAITLMTGVTVFFCNMELKQKPAALLRPVPPKGGQTILLEKIGFLWKRLSFTWKVTLRNIFRYKQRVFMTIVGVAGCTALLLTGFGLSDSINGVAERQYGEIFKYNALMVLKSETQKINGNLENLLVEEKVEDPVLIKQTTFEAGSGDKLLDTYLIVPENKELFAKYYNLTSQVTETGIKLDDSGVVITQKLAEVLNKSKGDAINIRDTDNHSYSLPISDVAENYMKNYVYMSKELYSTVFGEDASYNMIVSDYNQDETTLAKHLLESDSIANVTFKEDIVQRAVDGNASLNNVVVLVVIIASLLAVIVLYNLTSINISERKREIATLKVLGFTDKESNQYIYREAFMLTLISTGVGLLLGILFHRFVIGVIEGDASVYFKNIHGISFVWAALIIIIVSVIMQMVTYSKIKTIDMIESLKSVE